MAWKRDADGWPVFRHQWMPTWLRITVRVTILLPVAPLIWAGWLGEWLFKAVDPYLPRGL